jgi:hypothetical protein
LEPQKTSGRFNYKKYGVEKEMTQFRSKKDGSHYPISGGEATYPKTKNLNVKVQGEILEPYIHELLKNGFKVYAVKDKAPISWIYIEKNGQLGYVQNDYFGGLKFSTVHKPTQELGTGFSLNDEGTNNPTMKNAEESVSTHKPRWWTGSGAGIQKYKSFEDYQKSPTGSILHYVEVKEI